MKINILNSDVIVDTNSPYGTYEFYNVEGTEYYIDTDCYQIVELEDVAGFADNPNYTVEYKDIVSPEQGGYALLVEEAIELSKEQEEVTMKKLITLIVGITLISCSNDDKDCYNEKALASEYYSDLIEQSSEMQIELLEREFNRYMELKACDCMFFTNLKRIESKYNDLSLDHPDVLELELDINNGTK